MSENGRSKPELFRYAPAPRIQVMLPDGPCEVDIYSPEGYALLANLWTRAGWQQKASYEVTWLGVPIIQMPEDMVMMQELIWKLRPDVIIESGVAHGGSVILYASIQELLGKGRVIGIDVEIRKFNRLAMQSHPMSKRLTLIEGSSVDPATVTRVQSLIRPGESVLVALDSNHSAAHVGQELALYAPMVTAGSYLVVFDGVMQILPDAPLGSPTWDRDNPWQAVQDFLRTCHDFEVDPYYNRLRVTYCPGGFLYRGTSQGGAP